jgi:4-azaleucine resistance transporter AzlC
MGIPFSLTVYAGAMQFIPQFFPRRNWSDSNAVMTLVVNFRHIFYGLSFLDRFNGMGVKKWYMAFSLTDETYSLLAAERLPKAWMKGRFTFAFR